MEFFSPNFTCYISKAKTFTTFLITMCINVFPLVIVTFFKNEMTLLNSSISSAESFQLEIEGQEPTQVSFLLCLILEHHHSNLVYKSKFFACFGVNQFILILPTYLSNFFLKLTLRSTSYFIERRNYLVSFDCFLFSKKTFVTFMYICKNFFRIKMMRTKRLFLMNDTIYLKKLMK